MRVLEQRPDQAVHALRALKDEPEHLIRRIVQLGFVPAREQLRVGPHHTQRRLQVMRYDVRELRQLLVRTLQLVLGRLLFGDVGVRLDYRADFAAGIAVQHPVALDDYK